MDDATKIPPPPSVPRELRETFRPPTRRKDLSTWQREAYTLAAEKGFHSGPPDLPKFLMNLHGEISEAWEEYRKPDFDPTRTYYSDGGKPEGLPTELADLAIRILDTAEAFGIDLEGAMELKHEYNKTRPHRHGGKRA